jgi:hypothetical protein
VRDRVVLLVVDDVDIVLDLAAVTDAAGLRALL